MFPLRIKRLEASLENRGLSAVLLSAKEDIYYYTGYMPSEGMALIGRGRPILFVSPLESDAKKLKGIDVVFPKSKADVLKILGGFKAIGYDEHSLTVNRFLAFRKAAHLIKASCLIKGQREIKDSGEIERIKKAVGINKKIISGLAAGLHRVSEEGLAKRIDIEIREYGADNSFETIVASGRNSVCIHHFPGETVVSKTQPLIIDFGARVGWYCSDMSRSFSGSNNKMGNVLEDVKQMQGRIIDFSVAGKTMEEVQGFYNKLMSGKKYRVFHSVGHGIGLEVHERITGQLKNNMVFTVEPGVYLKAGGCRVEDVVVIRNGKAKKL